MFVERTISNKLEESVTYYPVLTITGPRQSGKTTLSRKIFQDYDYINLENPENAELATYDPKMMLLRNKKIILDEIQNVPKLLSYIQSIVDEKHDQKYILTGSNHFLLMEKITQSLAGRTAIAKLLPLSFEEIEFLTDFDADSLIFKGFYPALYAKNISPTIFYMNYLETYIQKDVRNVLDVRDLSAFTRFLKILATNIGSIINYSNIANDLGVSVPTIKSWISVLEASFIIFLLPPYFSNIKKRLVKRPKLYFYDVGLASYLLQLNSKNQIYNSRFRGKLFENMIISEFLKKKFNNFSNCEFYFLRDNTGNEVDLVIDKGEKLDFLEIKSSKTFHSQFFKGIKSFEKKFENIIDRKFVIYDGNSIDGVDINVLNFRNLSKILQF